MLGVLLLGFASGLPLALTGSTLFIWLSEQGVDKAAIGVFALLGIPYSLKFLWAPLIDGVRLPLLSRWLGRRRSWLLLAQIVLVASIVALGLSDPAADAWTVAYCALLVSISSATQDIVIDAYRVELLKPEAQGAGAAVLVLGYRIGMIVSTAGALYLATYMGWAMAYGVLALLLPLGLLAALALGEPAAAESREPMENGRTEAQQGSWLHTYLVRPFSEFMQRPGWAWVLAFVALYKLPDAFMGVMTGPFYLEQGFSKTQIAEVVKLYGVAATIAGGLLGGVLVARLSVLRALWVGGLLSAGTNVLFILLVGSGADTLVLALVITAENLASGLSAAALVAYISGLTNLAFTATQFALLSSLAAVGRTWFSAPAGWAATQLGWPLFFVVAALLAVPGMWVLWRLQRKPVSV